MNYKNDITQRDRFCRQPPTCFSSRDRSALAGKDIAGIAKSPTTESAVNKPPADLTDQIVLDCLEEEDSKDAEPNSQEPVGDLDSLEFDAVERLDDDVEWHLLPKRGFRTLPKVRGETQKLFPVVLSQGRAAITAYNPSVERVISGLMASSGFEPSDREIADALDIPVYHYQSVAQYLRGLEAGQLHGEFQANWIRQSLPHQVTQDCYKQLYCLRAEFSEQLRQALIRIPDCSHVLLRFRFIYEWNRSMGFVANLRPIGESAQERAFVMISVRSDFGRPQSPDERPWFQTDPFSSPPQDPDTVKTITHYESSLTEAHYYLYGCAKGWHPTAECWKVFGWRETWEKSFSAWYRGDSVTQLRLTKRKERHSGMTGDFC